MTPCYLKKKKNPLLLRKENKSFQERKRFHDFLYKFPEDILLSAYKKNLKCFPLCEILLTVTEFYAAYFYIGPTIFFLLVRY